MSLTAKQNAGGGGDFKNVEPGNYVGIAYQLIDLGTQRVEWLGQVKHQQKVYIRWELNEYMEDGRPFIIGNEYTNDLGDKANLRKMLEGFRGKAFTVDELKGFDLTQILGKACMVNVINKLSKDGTKEFAVIGAVTKLPKGMNVPELQNPIVYFDIDHWNDTTFTELPEFLRKKIMESAEYKMRGVKPDVPAQQGGGSTANQQLPEDDDIPFLAAPSFTRGWI